MKQEESVLVVPRQVLFSPASPEFQGFVAGDGEPYLSQVDARGTFLSRGRAEEDATFKQIIPYGIVLHEKSVFVMRRSADGGESRLHHKVSIGVGGHVNLSDGPPGGRPPADGLASRAGNDPEPWRPSRAWVIRSFHREIDEELIVDTPWSWEIAGVLNDDSNSVGEVHFGITFLVRPQTRAIRVREEELSEGAFVPIATLPELIEDMETWSAIVAGALLQSDLTSAR